MSRRGVQILDFDLNLAPIIDCFVVLITFMLASASFLSISIFDAGFAPVAAVGDPVPPPVTLTLNIKAKDAGYTVTVKGKMNSVTDFKTPEEAGQALKQIREKFPAVDSVTLTADDSVSYEGVVKTMEKVRPVIPAMILGGF